MQPVGLDVTFSPSKRHLALRPSWTRPREHSGPLLVTGARNWHHLGSVLSTTCGILVAADILAVGVYVSFPYVCFWIGRYGSADELPRRDHLLMVLAAKGPLSEPCGAEETTYRTFLCLVRIDGERTTKRPPRIYHLPFKVKDRRIQGDGYVCSPKPSAAAVIHMA